MQNRKYWVHGMDWKQIFAVIDVENGLEFDVNIPDYVYFGDILFERPTHHVKLIIKDVYRGTKYNDTCITALVDGEGNDTGEYYLKFLNDAIAEYDEF
jgi:hypothetical protein